MRTSSVLCLVMNLVSCWYLCPSASRPQYGRYPSRIVPPKFLPQIKLERSLRPIAPYGRSGQKRGIYLTPLTEIIPLKSPRRLARPKSHAQDLIDIADEAYHARMRVEIEDLKRFLNGFTRKRIES